MDSNSLPMKRKRRRRTLACEECRRRKVRCDREQPCSNCVQAYKPEQCFYQPDPMVTKSPTTRTSQVRKLSEEPAHVNQGDHDGRGSFGRAPGDRRGSMESDWHGSMTGTAPSTASATGTSTPSRFSTLPPPGGGGGGGSSSGYSHQMRDDYMSRRDDRESAFPSPGSTSRGPLPGISAVSGESEVSSLKEQVRRLENRLALVLNDQDEPLPPPPHHHRHHSPHRGPHFMHRPPHFHPHPMHLYPPPFPHHFGPPHMYPRHLDLPFHGRHDRRGRHDRHDRHGSHESDDRPDHHGRHGFHPHILPPMPPPPPPPMRPPPPSLPPPESSPSLPSPFHSGLEGFGPGPQMHRPGSPAPEEDERSSRMKYFSENHWMNGGLITIIQPLVKELKNAKDSKSSEFYQDMKRCKNLGRAIKAQRIPANLAIEYGKQVPSRETADNLINSYFRTFETVYRVLHIPTFTQDYRRYWENPSTASVNFVVQMQLCMAIGTAFYDETCSLRHLAVQWIYEAQLWLMAPAPSEKSRMNIPGLQTMCLLHLAREVSGIGADLVWISAGSLVRSAMFMGLHRDPTKIAKMPRYLAEMRRRLWATILEVTLQSSVDSGGPPLISLSDYDTLPPANFFDDQLMDRSASASNAAAAPPPKPLTTFTNTSMQIALLKSFPTRLAIARYINDFRSGSSYDEVLRLNSELRSACQALAGTIQSYRPSGSTGKLRPTTFQLRFVDHLTHRFFLSLNQAYLTASQSDLKFYFSRKVSVDTSLKLYQAWSGRAASSAPASGPTSTSSSSGPGALPSIWSIAVTGGPPSMGSPSPASANIHESASSMDLDDEPDDFFRLSVSGASGFRSVPVQCIAALSMDLLWQLEEEHSVRLRLGMRAANGGGAGGGSTNSSAQTSNESGGGYGNPGGDIPDWRPGSPHADAGSMNMAMPGVVTQSILLEALEDAVRFTEKRIRAGETNVKGYLFPCAVVSQARSLMRGVDVDELERTVVADCTEKLKHCVDLLREVASIQAGKTPDDDAATSISLGSDPAMIKSLDSAGFGAGAPRDTQASGNNDMLLGNGSEWGWEDLMQDQGFNFSFNTNEMDVFFSGM